MLQNKLNSDVMLFTTHAKPVSQRPWFLTGHEGGKTRNIAVFVARFTEA